MEYPASKAQKIILDALNLTAETHKEATDLFAKYGLSVSSKREGRKSIPAVCLLDATVGGFHNGDGDCVEISYKNIDLSPITQFMEV